MPLTADEREQFAERLRAEQATRYGGIARRAYNAAKVNSETWRRAVSAESIKDHTRLAIVANLWPATGGDWTQIPPVGAGPQDGEYVGAAGGVTAMGSVTNEDLLREILRSRAESDQIRGEQARQADELSALSGRVARLEQPNS